MNRRRFIQSLVAVFSLPAAPTFSLRSATAALPTAAVVPAQVRSWAVYMSTLHGECTPQALQTMLNISSAEAKNYLTQLLADGAIKPNPLLKQSVSDFVKSGEDSLLDRFKKRLEMKARTDSDEAPVPESLEPVENPDTEAELRQEPAEVALELTDMDEAEDTEIPLQNEAGFQN